MYHHIKDVLKKCEYFISFNEYNSDKGSVTRTVQETVQMLKEIYQIIISKKNFKFICSQFKLYLLFVALKHLLKSRQFNQMLK